MTDIHEPTENETFIKDFIEKIRFAHAQAAFWRNNLTASVHNPMTWRNVESQKKYIEELLVEIGWQAVQLYEAGEFEDTTDEEEEQACSLSEEDDEIDEEEESSQEIYTDHIEQRNDVAIQEDLEISESAISHEELQVFHKSLFSNSHIEDEIPALQEEYTAIDMWTDCGVLLCKDSTKEERDAFFRTVGSAVARGFFDCWRKDTGKIYDDIVRFFVSALLYIRTFPKDERPQSALGDGAFDFLIDKISASTKLRRKIDRYQESQEGSEVWLDRMEMFWNRVNGYFFEHERAKKDTVPFNEETALNRFQALLDGGSEKEIIHQLLYMVDHSMSADPRLVRILHSRADRCTLTQNPRFSALRRSLREMDTTEVVEMKKIWEHAVFFQGKDIIVIGGEKKRILIEHFTEIVPQANVRWIATSANSFAKRVQSLTKSVEQGSVDFVLVIQNFISHSAATPLFKASKGKKTNTHVEMIENGYGKREIKLALERCLRTKCSVFPNQLEP